MDFIPDFITVRIESRTVASFLVTAGLVRYSVLVSNFSDILQQLGWGIIAATFQVLRASTDSPLLFIFGLAHAVVSLTLGLGILYAGLVCLNQLREAVLSFGNATKEICRRAFLLGFRACIYVVPFVLLGALWQPQLLGMYAQYLGESTNQLLESYQAFIQGEESQEL